MSKKRKEVLEVCGFVAGIAAFLFLITTIYGAIGWAASPDGWGHRTWIAFGYGVGIEVFAMLAAGVVALVAWRVR